MSNIIIYGNGKTGKAMKALAHREGHSAFIYDDCPSKSEINLSEIAFDSIDLLVLSPGVKPDRPLERICKEHGIETVGELEYCFKMCKAKCVSVTGTNGKTTVTELIEHILRRSGKDTILLGNGGTPFATRADTLTKEQTAVLEISSFQLLNAETFSPYISVTLNLSPDHIDYHGSYSNYISAKCNNFLHQKKDAYAIFNADDAALLSLSEQSPCYTLYFSLDNPSANCRIENGEVVLSLGRKCERVKSDFILNELSHNKSNILAACLTAGILGVGLPEALSAAESYRYLPHRMENVGRVDGVTFIDDSKATNIHATNAALKSLRNCEVALILGGSDKGYGFDELFATLPENVKYIAAIGETSEKIRRSALKYSFYQFRIFPDLQTATEGAFVFLKERGGGTLLMSNACASFDMFQSYADRGEKFKIIARELMSA